MYFTLKIKFTTNIQENNTEKKILKLINIQNKNVKIKSVYNIKNRNKIFTLLRSPHVNKKSMEHFIYKNTSQRITIDIFTFLEAFNMLIFIKKMLGKNLEMNFTIIKKKKK